METWEMIKTLTENPTLKTRAKVADGGYFECFVTANKYLRFSRYTQDGVLVDSTVPRGGVNGNILINSEWELVPQEVPFIEAVKAFSEGKTIRCKVGEGVVNYTYTPDSLTKCKNISFGYSLGYDRNTAISTREILEGTWYID